MKAQTIIADRAEFIDALNLLRKGHVLVRAGESSHGCLLDGGIVYSAWEPLTQYGLVDQFDNPQGFPHASYYRLSDRGRHFADRAVSAWRSKPLWQRLAVRLTG